MTAMPEMVAIFNGFGGGASALVASAEFLKIDWSNYKDNFIEFANEIHKLSDDILISSPNDFQMAQTYLSKMKS